MKTSSLLLALVSFVAFPAHADVSPAQTGVLKKLMATYAVMVKEEAAKEGVKNPNLTFSAEVGREFYLKRRTFQSNDYTCSGCHTENPASTGKHIETKKPIKPLAPSVNPERFTDAAKVEKNFTQHCFDLHNRDCYAQEKGNFIAYLMSVK